MVESLTCWWVLDLLTVRDHLDLISQMWQIILIAPIQSNFILCHGNQFVMMNPSPFQAYEALTMSRRRKGQRISRQSQQIYRLNTRKPSRPTGITRKSHKQAWSFDDIQANFCEKSIHEECRSITHECHDIECLHTMQWCFYYVIYLQGKIRTKYAAKC